MKACSPQVQDPNSAAHLPSLPPDVQLSHVPVTEIQAATCDQTGHSSSLLDSSRQSEESTLTLASVLQNFYQHSLGITKVHTQHQTALLADVCMAEIPHERESS